MWEKSMRQKITKDFVFGILLEAGKEDAKTFPNRHIEDLRQSCWNQWIDWFDRCINAKEFPFSLFCECFPAYIQGIRSVRYKHED